MNSCLLTHRRCGMALDLVLRNNLSNSSMTFLSSDVTVPSGIVPCDECKGCYQPDLCYRLLRVLKMACFIELFVILLAHSHSAALLSAMEGNGGMVAVVQGLQDAGLAVTLLSQRHRPTGTSLLNGLVGAVCPTQACQKVVDSGTETAEKDYPNSTIYRSSYQLAHCQPSGFSPSHLPQYSFQGFQQFRSSPSRSPDEEAFVESLRKYPISPVRSRSADLIERMLSYTQTKNGARYSHTRSAKSLPSKDASKHLNSDEIPTRDTGIATNNLKSNFGYKRDCELIPVPTSNKPRHDNQIGMYDYLKSNHKDKKLKQKPEVRYLTNVKQCLRERLRQICDEEPTAICPKIQNRYNQHRRQYHTADASHKSQKVNYCKNLEKCTDCKESTTQDYSQNDIQISPSTSKNPKDSQVNKSLSTFKHSKACFCDRPGPCDCETQQSRSFFKPKVSSDYPEANKRKQCLSICEDECNIKEGGLREIVLNWLQELPVYANFSTKDTMKREEIINKLIDTLGKLPKDSAYNENAENEIKSCLKILPMWRPENKFDQESFENQLTFSLLQKIKSLASEKNNLKDEITTWIENIPFIRASIDREKIVNELIDKLKPITLNRPLNDKNYKEALKYEIASTLNDLPIEFTGSRTTMINNLADKLVEKLHSSPFAQPPSLIQSDIRNVVLDWIKQIPQISDDDDYVLVNDLVTRLNNLQNIDTNNRQEEMNNEITNWLNSIEEKKKCRIDYNTKNMLRGHLLNKLIELHEGQQPANDVNNVVQKWFDHLSNTLGDNFVENKNDLKILASKLQDLQSIENLENRKNTMRQEILKWLHNLESKQGAYVDSRTRENLINKLINMIIDESDVHKNVSENGLITQNIWKWLESQPEFKQNNSMQYRDMVIELSGKLQDIKDKKGEVTENDVKTELTNWFQKLSQERGIQIEPSNQIKLQDKLLSCFSPMKRRKNWEKPTNIQELVSKEVSDIINDSVVPLEENDLKVLRDQITHVMTQDWNAIHSTQNNEPISKIKNILKQATNLSETQINNLAHLLVEKVKDATVSNLGDIIGESPLTLDNISKDKLKSRVENILKMLPLKDKRQVIDKITDTLVKNYEEMQTNGGSEIIYDILKRANVGETVAQELTNKILDMSNQFRNEVTDTTYKSPTYGSAESLWMQKQMFMQRLEREITDFMEKVLNESSSFYKDKTAGLFTSDPVDDSINHYSTFKNPPLKTSTPTKSDSGQDMNLESQYKNQIKEIIRKWITTLEINDAVDESFKNEMVQDIATDIIDRQRYIQLSKTTRSSQDEMEHLRYQIFKWTSKLPNRIDLAIKTAEIKMLIKSLEALEIPNFIRELNKQQDMTNKKVGSGSIMESNGHILTQDTSEFMEENIYGAIWNWLNEISNLKPRSSKDRRDMDELIINLSKKLNNILSLHQNTQALDIENLFKNEIINCLKKINRHLANTEELLEPRASELLNYLKCLDFFTKTLKYNQEIPQEAANKLRKKDAIKKAVQNWCRKLPLQKGKTYDDMKDTVDNLAEAVSRYLLITEMDNLNTFMDDILNNLKKLPLQFDKEDSKYLPEFTERLIETLKNVLNDSERYYSNTQNETINSKPAFKKAVEVMYDNIQSWCENLPIDLGVTNEDIDQVNMIKQNLAGKLLKKVGELNLDPEIFNDDYLYEDVLKDEIEKILDSLPKTKQLEEILPTLKENLMKNLLEAKEGMKNEMAGFAYKQQLRDAISKTLSSIGLTILEETPFEVLKDNLADAFINLHYIADDEEIKRKFKDKIFNEVNKFCDDYLKRNPSTRLNAHQLNQELYKALKKVPVPKDESLRREVEQIRVKDIVTEWIKDMPFEETPSHVQENKIISILAKKLHELENQAELNPDLDIDEIMNNEISKWLRKFKLKSGTDSNTEQLKKKLINKLKATKNSRKLNELTIRKSINYADLTSDLDESVRYPPSDLSAEDRAHLQRIKDRTSIERIEQSNVTPDDKKDASVSPVPITTGMQTEEKQVSDNYIYQKISQNASIQTIIRDPEPPTAITPQVIVKEYYWNSHGSPTMQRSGSILSSTLSPVTQLAGSTQQKAIITHETPNATAASQTLPLPATKATLTQGASFEQIIKTQNGNIGASSKYITSKQQLSNEINIEPQIGQYNPDDYLQLNLKKKAEIKSCQPCRGRALLTGELNSGPEAGTSKDFQQARSTLQQMAQDTIEQTDFRRHRPEFHSAGHIIERKNCLDDQGNLNQPCYRRSIYQSPTRDVECVPKRKKRNQPCNCRKPTLTKCTILPQSPCQLNQSNKSCYVAKKHCPKCWDGFCPHPSYLYFRQD